MNACTGRSIHNHVSQSYFEMIEKYRTDDNFHFQSITTACSGDIGLLLMFACRHMFACVCVSIMNRMHVDLRFILLGIMATGIRYTLLY